MLNFISCITISLSLLLLWSTIKKSGKFNSSMPYGTYYFCSLSFWVASLCYAYLAFYPHSKNMTVIGRTSLAVLFVAASLIHPTFINKQK